jgi:hypothetical protein
MKKEVRIPEGKSVERLQREPLAILSERPIDTLSDMLRRELEMNSSISQKKLMKICEKVFKADEKFMKQEKKFHVIPKENEIVEIIVNEILKSVVIPEGTEVIHWVNNENQRKKLDHRLHRKGKNKTHIVLMSLAPTAIHQLEGVMKLKGSVEAQVKKAREILVANTGNSWVTIITGSITAVGTLITNYESSSPGGRKTARRLMMNGFNDLLLAKFQAAANNDPDNANDILTSGLYFVKTVAIRQKNGFTVKNSSITGKILSTCPRGPSSGFAIDWWITYDNGVTSVRMDPTLAAKTSKAGLTIKTSVGIAYQIITRKGPQGISAFTYVIVT